MAPQDAAAPEQQSPDQAEDDLVDVLAAEDAAEEIDNGNDVSMHSGSQDDDDDDQEELVLTNDSIAYFDQPPDSLFAIAQHPVHPSLVAVGGSAGATDDAPGAGWVVDTAAAQARPRPVLPASFASSGPASASASSSTSSPVALDALFALDGHTDSINSLCWTLPAGQVLVSGGLDGRIQAWAAVGDGAVAGGRGNLQLTPLGGAQEVDEINWLAPCPCPSSSSSSTAAVAAGNRPPANTVALGAGDGSVWVYTVDPSDAANPLQMVQSYFLHTGACTAGAWTPDGQLLATVSEDGTLYVWDVWGTAAASAAVNTHQTQTQTQTVVSMTPADQRFEVPGGLYSVAIDPRATFVAVGGAGGVIKIVSLPRLTPAADYLPSSSSSTTTVTAGGQILASLHSQSDGVETLDVALAQTTPATVLLAAGSVNGSICVYDATRRFAVRRHIVGAHDEHSVVKVEFVGDSWTLTSCGMDGVVRRWDLRGTGADIGGLVREWRGHRGDGEGGGVLGFVQGLTGERIVTAGDDGVALVFQA